MADNYYVAAARIKTTEGYRYQEMKKNGSVIKFRNIEDARYWAKGMIVGNKASSIRISKVQAWYTDAGSRLGQSIIIGTITGGPLDYYWTDAKTKTKYKLIGNGKITQIKTRTNTAGLVNTDVKVKRFF